MIGAKELPEAVAAANRSAKRTLAIFVKNYNSWIIIIHVICRNVHCLHCALFGSLSLRVAPIEMIEGPAFSAIGTKPEPAFVAPPTFTAASDRSLAFLT